MPRRIWLTTLYAYFNAGFITLGFAVAVILGVGQKALLDMVSADVKKLLPIPQGDTSLLMVTALLVWFSGLANALILGVGAYKLRRRKAFGWALLVSHFVFSSLWIVALLELPQLRIDPSQLNRKGGQVAVNVEVRKQLFSFTDDQQTRDKFERDISALKHTPSVYRGLSLFSLISPLFFAWVFFSAKTKAFLGWSSLPREEVRLAVLLGFLYALAVTGSQRVYWDEFISQMSSGSAPRQLTSHSDAH
jgi:hypothetical protein